MARLLLSTPDGQRTVELRAKNSLGRHPDNSIQLLDKIVSKEHCKIELRGNDFVLIDLGSLNGTYVAGQRVNGEVHLQEGAEIAMGQTTAKFVDAAMLPAVPTPPAWDHPTAAIPHQQVGQRLAEGQPQGRPAPGGFAPAPGSSSPISSVSGNARRIGMKTRVDLSDAARPIGTQIDATLKGFLPWKQIAQDQAQAAQDYERLRLSHELAREIALERDLDTLLAKILETIFRFVRADRGVILLQSEEEGLSPAASYRRDGTNAPIPVSSTIMNHVVKERATVLTHDAAMDFAASKGKSMILNNISSAIVAPLLHEDEILGVLWLDSQSLAQFQQKDLEIVTAIANQAAMFIEINILGKKMEQEVVNRERFSRLLSPNVAEKVLSGELEVKKGGRLVQGCTVFNSDIRGFTAMSEKSSPEEMVDMLNEYFELMVESIFDFEGTLDKFMGDGIMALWGAPVVHPDDAIRSVRCALRQIEVLEAFNQRRTAAGKHSLEVGFGIHTGPLVAGYIGSSKALSYTVIGDTANTSARLCGVAKSGEIVVSETTLEQLRDEFHFQELAPASLKNKEKPFRCFNVTGAR
jgi:adenylate cyclase